MKFIKNHRYTLLAMIAGISAYVGLDTLGVEETYLLALSWNITITLYMVAILIALLPDDRKKLAERARTFDMAAFTLFALMIGAAFLSLNESLSLLKEAQKGKYYALPLALLTVVLSWFFVQIIFAVHYTDHYYLSHRNDPSAEGFRFPHCEKDGPLFTDFLYVSSVLGATFQVSDVQVTTRRMRRLVMAHGIIAFFFSTFVLALSVNMAAGMMGGK